MMIFKPLESYDIDNWKVRYDCQFSDIFSKQLLRIVSTESEKRSEKLFDIRGQENTDLKR